MSSATWRKRRDADGNLVNLYAPVTDDARSRFAER
jgi:hypothetical protein